MDQEHSNNVINSAIYQILEQLKADLSPDFELSNDTIAKIREDIFNDISNKLQGPEA